MRHVDLHPEELLDKELEGALDERERERLFEHREQCAACDFEQQLMRDFGAFADEEPTEADGALLSRALEQLEEDEVRPVERRRQSSLLVRLAVAAGLLLLTSASAAGVISVVSAWIDADEVGRTEAATTEDEDEAEEVEINRRAVGPARGSSSAIGDQRDGASEEEAATVDESAVEDVAVLPTSAPQAAAVEATSPVRLESLEQGRAPAEPSAFEGRDRTPSRIATDESDQLSGPTAAELMSEASRARRAGDYHGAVQRYRELARRFPSSREAVTSRVSMGRILLDRLNNPAGALHAFDGYLRSAPSGTLAQEALVGRALSLRRLGRQPAERRAWNRLLERHPNSIHAARARQRLEALSEGESPAPDGSNGRESLE